MFFSIKFFRFFFNFFYQLIRSATDISWSDQQISWFIWSANQLIYLINWFYLISTLDLTSWYDLNVWKLKKSKMFPTDRLTDRPTFLLSTNIFFHIHSQIFWILWTQNAQCASLIKGSYMSQTTIKIYPYVLRI